MTVRPAFFLFLCILGITSAGDTFAQETGEESEVTLEIEEESLHRLREPDSLETTRAYRQSDLPVHKFDDMRWEEIVGGQDYNEKPVIKRGFDFPTFAWAGPIVKVIAYALVIALVSAAVWYIITNITFGVKVERKEILNEDLEKPLENIEALDIEGLLDQARREGNFKMAVRLYYLGLLKRLNGLGKISWKKDKTNRDYLAEVFSVGFYYAEIQKLTRSYEEVWYGDHTLEDNAFEQLKASFEEVYQRIHTVKTL